MRLPNFAVCMAAFLASLVIVALPNISYAQTVRATASDGTGGYRDLQVDVNGYLKTLGAGVNGGAVGTGGWTPICGYDGTTCRALKSDANGLVTIPGLVASWWRYVPPVGGYLNITTGVTVTTAKGAGVSNYVWGGECFSDALTTATEVELRDGAAGTAMWRMKVPTSGWTTGFDINFNPPLRGSANTLVEFAGTTASGAGAIYCNWRGTTGG